MPVLESTKQTVFRIPMPWRQRYYAVNWDADMIGRPVLVIAWYFEFGCFFFRMGWVFNA